MPVVDIVSEPAPLSDRPALRRVLETVAEAHRKAAVEWRGKADTAEDSYSEYKAKEEAARHEKRAQALVAGIRGGRYYISPTGNKVYVSSNPGARTVSHMSSQRFIGGLPVSCHLAEPRRR